MKRSDRALDRMPGDAPPDDVWIPTCPVCDAFIEDCSCACPFCGERAGCTCCIGYGVATGGD
jgi:hypothetical protein